MGGMPEWEACQEWEVCQGWGGRNKTQKTKIKQKKKALLIYSLTKTLNDIINKL